MYHLAVIGAGAAGLAAARILAEHGFAVTVCEKSRGVGGRASTRRVHGCTIDHGAQVVQTPTAELRQLITTAPPPELPDVTSAHDIGLPVWIFDGAGTVQEGDPERNRQPRWCWPTGMTTLSKLLAYELDIHFETRVNRITATTGGYTLHTEQGQPLGIAHAVLLTPPAPQAAELIAASSLTDALHNRLLDELAKASFRRTLSIALAYARRPSLPWYALVNTDRQHSLVWLACEHAKPGHAPDDQALMLAHLADDFSTSHWDDLPKGTYDAHDASLPAYLPWVHAQVRALTGTDLGSPLWADVHRWRYAQPDSEADFAALNGTGSGLYFAGDYTTGRGRVHEAIESGWRVAEMIRNDFTD
jgi:hypothetical protein